MIKYLKTITLLLLCTFLLTGTSLASGYKKHTITVATASNALKAVEAITELFTKESGVEVVIVSGSTGKLYSQIVMGAPYDVFLAADKKRPKLLFDKELTKGEPFTYAKGSLIFWSAKSVPGMGEYGLDLLLDDDIKRIAIANPKTAPYGAAAVEVLKNSGLYEQVEAKLVYGESVSHTVGFVLSRN
ncbi:MAG: molybdate ABC transporter substrate-binding protein, partial [Deltaproteobacteria bacterium]|nr:molybdate ABC transporter substrate-binding protein [Deltaproteobacteria bacterium]